MEDPIAVLEHAVALTRAAGVECTGWLIQSGEGHICAWLYREDENGQWPLMDEVDVFATAIDAARSCLTWAEHLSEN